MNNNIKTVLIDSGTAQLIIPLITDQHKKLRELEVMMILHCAPGDDSWASMAEARVRIEDLLKQLYGVL